VSRIVVGTENTTGAFAFYLSFWGRGGNLDSESIPRAEGEKREEKIIERRV
jgi:hypothetical protein